MKNKTNVKKSLPQTKVYDAGLLARIPEGGTMRWSLNDREAGGGQGTDEGMEYVHPGGSGDGEAQAVPPHLLLERPGPHFPSGPGGRGAQPCGAPEGGELFLQGPL